MYQHAGLSAPGPCRHHNVLRHLVVDDILLTVVETSEQLFVFGGSDVVVDFRFALAFEVLGDEFAEVHLEIVFHKLQCRIVIAHHHPCKLAHDMYLLDTLFIEFIKQPVLFFAVACPAFQLPFQLHGVVYHEKTSGNLQQRGLRQIEQRLIHIGQCNLLPVPELKLLRGALITIQQFHLRKVHQRLPLNIALPTRLLALPVGLLNGHSQLPHNETA